MVCGPVCIPPTHSLNKRSLTVTTISVCKANAEQAHALHHWKFALNELVVQVLEQDGELEPQKLVEREKMKRKKRTEYANRVVDNWGATRRIKDLWSDFKNMTGTARGLQEVSGRRGGWK